MNDRDTEANTKAIDSLLNFETVKYFGNEAHEAMRFDDSMRRYEEASVRNTVTLSYLNVGQACIISAGLILIMFMAGNEVVEKTMTVGDFVMVNAYLIQLYLPLNFLGFVYRQIRQSLTDMEVMFNVLEVPEEITDKMGAEPLAVNGAEVQFVNVDFSLRNRLV